MKDIFTKIHNEIVNAHAKELKALVQRGDKEEIRVFFGRILVETSERFTRDVEAGIIDNARFLILGATGGGVAERRSLIRAQREFEKLMLQDMLEEINLEH